MALFERLANWFDRVFDMSEEGDVALEGMDADAGLLMSAPKGTPPAIPQLPAQPAEASAPEAADANGYGDVPDTPAAQAAPADDTVIEETPAPAPTRPAVKVVSLAKAIDADVPEDVSAEEAAAEQTPDEGETPDGPTPSEEPAPLVVAAGGSNETPEQEQEAMVTASGGSPDALLSAFKKSGEVSEVAVYTKDMDDVAIADLLTDAREVLAMLPKKEAA